VAILMTFYRWFCILLPVIGMWLEIMSFRLCSQLVHNEGLMHTRMATILIICFPSLLTCPFQRHVKQSLQYWHGYLSVQWE